MKKVLIIGGLLLVLAAGIDTASSKPTSGFQKESTQADPVEVSTPTPTVTLFPTSTPIPTPTPTIYIPPVYSPPQIQYCAGASAICSDGTCSYSAHRQGTCSHHGGVAQWL